MLSHTLFLFKQKTAYEMRFSDWSSDVCSSDRGEMPAEQPHRDRERDAHQRGSDERRADRAQAVERADARRPAEQPDLHRQGEIGSSDIGDRDRKRVVVGKRAAGRVDSGGCRINKKKKEQTVNTRGKQNT